MATIHPMYKGHITMPSNSHYVPRFILANHGQTITCFNTISGEFLYKRDPTTVYSEMGYYPDDIETLLNIKAEAKFSKFLKQLLDKNTIELTYDEVATIRRFLLVTKMRSKETLKQIEQDRTLWKKMMADDPDTLKAMMGKYIDEVNSDESAYDYWIRSIRCILEEDTGVFAELYDEKNATFFAVQLCKTFANGFLAFWDAPEGLSFIINDKGMSSENEPAFYEGGYNHYKIDDLKKRIDCLDPNDPSAALFHTALDANTCFEENYFIFPFSAKRAIVLFNPYFNLLHNIKELIPDTEESVSDVKSRDEILNNLFNRVTMLSNPALTVRHVIKYDLKPGRFDYLDYMDNARLIFQPVTLSTEELITVNYTAIGSCIEWIAFGDFVKASLGFYVMREINKNYPNDRFKPMYSLLDHIDDEEYLKRADEESVFSKLEKLDIPERFSPLLGKRVGMNFVIDISQKEQYPTIAAALVLSRNKLLQLDSECDEDTILGVFEKLEMDILWRYYDYYNEREQGEFSKEMEMVFLEALAMKRQPQAMYKAGKSYLIGKYVPKNDVKAEKYLKDVARQNNSLARLALGRLYLDQKRYEEAAEIAVGPNGVRSTYQYRIRAKARLKLKDFDGAISDYWKAIEGGDYKCAYKLLGIYLNRGKKHFNLDEAKRVVDVLPPESSQPARLLINYYVDHIEERPEYRAEISRILDKMIEGDCEKALVRKQKLIDQGIL